MPIKKSELLAVLKELAKEGGSDLKAAQDALKIESEKKQADTSVFEKLGESAQKAAIEVEKLKVAKLEYLDVEAKIAEIEGDREAELRSYNKMYEQYTKLLDMSNQAEGEAAELAAAEVAEMQNRIEAMGLTEEGLKGLSLEYEKLSPLMLEATKKGNSLGEGFATAASKVFPIYSKGMTGMVNKLEEYIEIAKKEDGAKGLVKGFRQVVNMKNVVLAVTAQVIGSTLELAMASDKASAAFAAQTGAGREMTAVISNVAGANRNLGLSAELAGKAATDLYENFSGFMQLGQGAQEALTETVAQLGRIGIDGKTASDALVLFSKNMGMSIKQSQKVTKQLAMMGTQIGISSSKMVKGFVEASKSLAVYGKDAVKVFSDLAAQAKAANVETSTLLGLAEKFDTFEGAADSAGKLNAILGTNISATDMLTMKENERVEMLIRSIQAQGIAFKDMDRFSQKAVANAAGISDMAEAQRIFGMSVSDYRKGLKGNVEEEKFQQALKDTMDIMEKLKKAGQAFAISLGPFIDKIATAVQELADFNQEMGGNFVPIMIAIGAAGIIFAKALALIVPLLGVFGVTAPSAGLGATILGSGLSIAGAGIKSSLLPLLGLAAAMVLLFGAFALISGGTGLTGGAMFGFFAALAGGLILFAGALAIVGLMAPYIAFASAVIGVMAAALVVLGGSLAFVLLMLDGEKLKSLGEIFGGLGNFMVSFKAEAFTDTSAFLKELKGLDATIKPVLGDLALVATGKTAQDVTTNTAAYSFQQFSANFKNIFRPEITVKIGEQELKEFVIKTVNE